MDLDQLKQILDLVREHELSEFEIEQDGLRLKIRKDAAGALRGRAGAFRRAPRPPPAPAAGRAAAAAAAGAVGAVSRERRRTSSWRSSSRRSSARSIGRPSPARRRSSRSAPR